MKKIWNQNTSGIIISIFEILIGILLLVKPAGFTSVIIILFGIVLCFFGISSIIEYFHQDIEEAAKGQDLTKGLLFLVAGFFCVFQHSWFVGTFSVVAILYGIMMLVTGLAKVQTAVDMVRMKRKSWTWLASSAALSIVCAVIILNNPFKTNEVLWMFTGIVLIMEAILDVIIIVIRKKEDSLNEPESKGRDI